jgi:hypothetical protein
MLVEKLHAKCSVRKPFIFEDNSTTKQKEINWE